MVKLSTLIPFCTISSSFFTSFANLVLSSLTNLMMRRVFFCFLLCREYGFCERIISFGEALSKTNFPQPLKAVFKFRNIQTNEEYSIASNSDRLQIVETIPGWAHNIENIGESEMLVILWANEVFNKEKPDTYTYLINNEKT